MDKIEVTQADRTLYHQLLSLGSVNLNRRRMGLPIVDGFELIAAHRLATRTDATPVAFISAERLNRKREFEANGAVVYDRPLGTSTMPLYTHPPATDVAALVENGCEMPEVAAMRYIEELRSDLAASVTILCDNEEAWTKDEQMAVEVIAEWTDWIAKRFMGESVIQCLARAIGARRQALAPFTKGQNDE